MSEYLFLIYADESATVDPGAGETIMKEHVVFQEKHGASLRGGNALQGTSTATTVRPEASGYSGCPKAGW